MFEFDLQNMFAGFVKAGEETRTCFVTYDHEGVTEVTAGVAHGG